MMIGASLGLLVLFLMAGCGQDSKARSDGSSQAAASQEKEPSQAPSDTLIKGEIGEPMDLGPSTITITEAYKTRPNPPMGYDNKHFEGPFLLVVFDYTNNQKQPVEVSGTEAPWWIEDSKGRQFSTHQQGFGSTVALTSGAGGGGPEFHPEGRRPRMSAVWCFLCRGSRA
jgi:hypothetical protein